MRCRGLVVLLTAVAFLLGWLLAWAFLATRPVVSINAFAVPLEVTTRSILVGLVAIIVLAWIAGRLAARRYARAEIIELVGR